MFNKTINDSEHSSKIVYEKNEIFYTEFMNSYDEHGFGGTRKKNLLTYYFN